MSKLEAVSLFGTVPVDNPNVYQVPRPNPVNVELLEEEARAVFPSTVLWSVDEYKDGPNKFINFGFLAPPTSQQQTDVDTIITNHNPTGQTQAQIKQAEAAQRLVDFQTYFDTAAPNAIQVRDTLEKLLLHLGLVAE